MAEFRIIEGDCLDHITGIQADALITDPPYGQNYKPGRPVSGQVMKGMRVMNSQWTQIQGEDQAFDPTPFLDFQIVCLWGANHYADRLPASPGWFIWDKRCGMPSNDQADCEMAWTNRPVAARIYRQVWNGIIREGRENISRAGAKLHPHQKPEALMGWCLYQLGIEAGMTVVDPFMGSGTTGVMCLEMGINFIGIELEHQWCVVAEKRLRTASRRIPLIPAHIEFVQEELF